MAKVYKFINDPLQPATEAFDTLCLPVDWNKCILCQTDTSEILSCPADSKLITKGAGYKTVAENLQAFEKIGCLPKTINLLNEGEGTEASFQQHKAKWHDSCRLKFNKTKLQRAEKRKEAPDDSSSSKSPRKYARRSLEKLPNPIDQCFFCGKRAEGEESLHRASTLELDARVRHCALQLQDKPLLAKLSAGDMVAQDAEYHVKCLVSLYNRARGTETYSAESDADAVNHGIAFAELVSYIEDARMDNLVAPIFKLSDLVSLYSNRLKQLGKELAGRIHSTKLKIRVLTELLYRHGSSYPRP